MKRNLFNFIAVAVLLFVAIVACDRDKHVTGVTLSVTTYTLEIDDYFILTATVQPNDATNKIVSWESSDDKIATVTERGIVTAIADGTAIITVTTEDGGKTATCRIIVSPYPAPIEPEMITVEGGLFTMGCTDGDCRDNELPIRQVRIDSYQIAKYPVTQREWRTIMRTNSDPSHFKGDDRPVESVSFSEIEEFIELLNKATNKNYRLCTEAEWEFAAREGKNNGFKFSGSNNLDEVAWHRGNSKGETQPVGQKKPNALGIYDMSGNVYEYCSNRYGAYASPSDSTGAQIDTITGVWINPQGPAIGGYHVARGGSWQSLGQSHRVAARYEPRITSPPNHIGFRLAHDKK